MSVSFKDEVLNGVISFITGVADHHPETEGLLVIRKYEDDARPNASLYGRSSCEEDVYENSVFAEINIENFKKKNVCKQNIFEDGVHKEVSIKNYIVEVQIDFFGCGATDVVKLVLDAIELWELRKKYLPCNLGFLTHTDAVDITELQETLHEERFTVTMDFEYCCETTVDLPQIQLGKCTSGIMIKC